jgi:TolB protein
VDLRTKFESGLDELAKALKDYINVKQDIASQSQVNLKRPPAPQPAALDWKKFAIPALIAVIGLFCLTSGFFAIRFIGNLTDTPTETATRPGDIDPVITVTATEPVVVDPNEPTGRIVYTCSIKGDEICMINADGSGWRQLTDSLLGNFNASLSPDGKSIVYIGSDGTVSEIYEMDLASGKIEQLTSMGKALGAPEISPDGTRIVFHYRDGNSAVQLWIMDRDGSNPRELYSKPGNDVHDGTWSPDGSQILLAIGKDDKNKLYIMDVDGGTPQVVNDGIDTRGRSDWSVGGLISFDQGGPFAHDVYVMGTDGSGLRRVSPTGINAQGASLSPDGKWIAFTGYTDVAGRDQDSCEIFVMRADGSDLRQLTENQYCDYQPRWGK